MTSEFIVEDSQTIYLDGNSLGRLPAATVDAVQEVIKTQWGGELIEGWDRWMDLPGQIGDLLAEGLLGAASGSVMVADSTTVNLYKLAAAGLAAKPGRSRIITDRGNFPTNRYVMEGLGEATGAQIDWLEVDPVQGPRAEDVAQVIGTDTALVSLSHVGYQNAAIADMSAINALAQQAGAFTLWDLSHSVGAVPIALAATGTDLAVGCTYKYLNGGPGSPAFIFVRPDLQTTLRQPIWGWFGQRNQFDMGPTYDPVDDISRFTVGSPPVIALAATLAGVRSMVDIGIEKLRRTSIELTECLIEEAERLLLPLGFVLGSPRDSAQRGGHVLLRHPRARAVSVIMRQEVKVIDDFRQPDGLRLAPAPAYTTRGQVVEAINRIASLVASGRHNQIELSSQRVT